MEFSDWLRTWLTRHPLKAPHQVRLTQYTAEVMARIKSLETRTAQVRATSIGWRWFLWPRSVLAVATIAAVFAIAIRVQHHSTRQLAKGIVKESELLDALNGTSAESGSEGLSEELQAADTMVLAESEPRDEQWLEQTSQLLDQLDESESVGQSGSSSDEEDWLNELERLDETELFANS